MKVAIVGGGAAGLMTAAAIIEADASIELFLVERNDGLGKKVIISGGGRCNVTTGIPDIRTVLTKYPRGGKFLNSAIRRFPPSAVMEWFEAHGVPLKTQEDQRVFPQSDDGHDVVAAFERLFAESNITTLLNTHVTGITRREEGGFALALRGQAEPLAVDKVVLTTGGQAYRATGSTGDGYAFALSLGHTLTPLAPSLNSFGTRERWPADVSGLSFANATISADRAGQPTFSGPFLFTHRGISGPAVFALSSLTAFEKYDQLTPMRLSVDLFPDETVTELTDRFLAAIEANARKDFSNVAALIVTRSLSAIMLEQLAVPGGRNAGEIGRKDVLRCAEWLKGIPLHAISRGAGDEFVTAGGVPLTEVDPSTMESRICPGLYFAGEILDVDGFTGGFNLQASWAAGRLAGESIAAAA